MDGWTRKKNMSRKIKTPTKHQKFTYLINSSRLEVNHLKKVCNLQNNQIINRCVTVRAEPKARDRPNKKLDQWRKVAGKSDKESTKQSGYLTV